MAETPEATKSFDKDLARLQTFVLDELLPLNALAHLTALAECANSTPMEELRLAITSAFHLIGNASARICTSVPRVFTKTFEPIAALGRELQLRLVF